MSWKVHETDEVFAALRGLCANSYRMYDPCEHRYYYDHECDAYECVVEDAAEEYERLLKHCNHQREQLKSWGNVPTLRKIMEGGMDNIDGGTEVEHIRGSITDELREYAEENECESYRKLLTAIADRIDAEHAEAVADALQLRGEPDRWVKLPVDADGVPIHVGDELDGLHYEDGTVTGIQFGADGRAMVAIRPNGWDTSTWHDPEEYRHRKPDSWERIIEDAAWYGKERQFVGTSGDLERIAELIERCRRLAGERG